MLFFYMDSIYWALFTVAFLLIKKAWDDQFSSKVGGGIGDFKKWGDPIHGRDNFEKGGWYPLWTMSKVKGNITYQNTNFSAMNLVTMRSILDF